MAEPAHNPTPEPLDVVAIGSALVDVLVKATADDLVALELPKGSMSLVERDRAEAVHLGVRGAVEVSGGSAANTMVGVARLGGRAGFVGKVANDRLGEVFTHDIGAASVRFEPTGRADADGVGTGRVLVLVTEDADRTMATYLGAATTLSPKDVPAELLQGTQVVYLEGYLWDLPAAIEAMRRAIGLGHETGASVALSLSDPFCVQRHQREFLELVREDVDVLFGNEEEVVMLFGVENFEAAIVSAEETGLLVAATRGPKGSVVTTAHGPVAVPAAPVDQVVDTTGAGDLYAAGFLYGLTHGADPVRCAELGGLCAAEVIGHLGGRPETDLRALAEGAGLL